MKFTYCPTCGQKLVPKIIGDEGYVPFCESCGKPLFDYFYTCTISLAVNEQGEAALIKQGYVSQTSHVCIAGYMKSGENAESAAAREVGEELGLKVLSTEYINSYYYPKKDMLMLGFVCRVNKDSFNISQEVDSAEWFSYDEAEQKLKNSSIALQLLKDYRAKYSL